MNSEKIEQLIAAMTLEEKIGMIHGDNIYDTKGVERLGIPPFRFSDGPMGTRPDFVRETLEELDTTENLTTSFPCPTAVAATWNRELAHANGNALGCEVRGRGRDLSLSPGINIHRVPQCGRNFEYMSEDPHLISEMCVEVIKGLQENDIGACVKHFAVNNQETRRFDVNVEVDERTLHEIYLPGFKAAIQKGKSVSIMGAYNKFRGDFCCHNRYLLKDLLRDQWGFDGVVISDWDALHDTKKGIEAGVDFDMKVSTDYDNYYYANPLMKMIESGEVKEETIDEMIRRILNVMFRLKMFDSDRKSGSYNTEEIRKAILDVARESLVLLKNDKDILPLPMDSKKTIAVIGDNANRRQAFGGGSSEVNALFEITPLLGLKMFLGGNYKVNYARGYAPDADEETAGKLKEKALALAAASDVVIYVGGLNHDYDTEGKDREDIKLPFGQDELIQELLRVQPDTVIVNMSGSPVEMNKWINDAHAVVQYWYSGTMGGTALAEVLFGKVNPSGKLTATFPKKLEDTPVWRFGEFPGGDTVEYKEGIYVGYRYYDSFDVEPEFCFGHGLSYTTFGYSDMVVESNGKSGEELSVRISLTLTNLGEREGLEVVQLYVADPNCSVPRPRKELKDFEKVSLKPGETAKVTFELQKDDFSYYCVEEAGWKMESNEFGILVGSSSRDIRLQQTVEL